MSGFGRAHAKRDGTLDQRVPTVERDPATGELRLVGELDFAVVPTVRAELAMQLDSAGSHAVDLSSLARLTPAGVTFLEELLEEHVALRCARDCAAYEVLDAVGMLDRVEIVC
ncbi:hypothetical protein P5P86_17730 [Nocardioides sp. BP30]|uniref:hypothetical protein n=1 Tax=Nocardioides sp. BP30 TaxID=3036374 RepID=UPI002468ED3A|nr:hypothetical protein [Nocardioides sp. BP30]WGL51782.1 hypothetical protein P5P86_17730 [Nocardioides sp. BP30]